MHVFVVDNERNLSVSFSENISRADLLGQFDCQLGHILSTREFLLEKDLVECRTGGSIRILAEELAEGARADDTLVLHMHGQASTILLYDNNTREETQ